MQSCFHHCLHYATHEMVFDQGIIGNCVIVQYKIKLTPKPPIKMYHPDVDRFQDQMAGDFDFSV